MFLKYLNGKTKCVIPKKRNKSRKQAKKKRGEEEKARSTMDGGMAERSKEKGFFLQESKMNIRNSGWVGKNRVKIKAKEKNLFSFISFIQMRQLCCQEILSY